jgi:AAA ATPase domain
MRLSTLTIERFKRIERVDFNLSGMNILIGGNNSGKSTIVQAVHFAFTLLQSLTISEKWPVQAKKSSTISPTELIYIPSEDPYSLGYGGKLLEDAAKSIVIRLTFEDGQIINLSIRKGRITNIIVEPDNVEYAKSLSKLETPYSVFSPGLAGVARTEVHVSDGVLLRALARGDANAFVRNILYRLQNRKKEWPQFEADLSTIFPHLTITRLEQ